MRERPRVSLFQRIAAAVVVAAVGLACATVARSAPKDGPAVWSHLSALSKEERLAELKREAAAEGELVIYSAIGLDRASVFLDMFKRQHPGIKVEYLRMTTNELAQKVLTE